MLAALYWIKALIMFLLWLVLLPPMAIYYWCKRERWRSLMKREMRRCGMPEPDAAALAWEATRILPERWRKR